MSEPAPGAEPLGAAPSRIFGDGALAGRVALVTGGGTNLGKAAAVELARCGASVLIAGRREDVLAATAAAIDERCSWVSGDIRERGDADRIVQTALQRHGRLDFVLNNAGGQYFVPAERITIKGWRAVQRLNIGGTLAMCHAAHELAMRPAGAGTIVNVTVSPHHGMPAMAHTGAARAAVEALTRELAADWAAHGVTVTAVAIGRFATESLRKYPAELWKTGAPWMIGGDSRSRFRPEQGFWSSERRVEVACASAAGLWTARWAPCPAIVGTADACSSGQGWPRLRAGASG